MPHILGKCARNRSRACIPALLRKAQHAFIVQNTFMKKHVYSHIKERALKPPHTN